MPLNIKQLHESFIGEVTDIDLTQPLSPDEIEAVQTAIDRHLVLVFPNQNINDDQQLRFSSYFGPMHKSITINRTDMERRLKKDELSDISNIDQDGNRLPPEDRRRRQQLANLLWHTDNSFRDPKSSYTLLAARIVPEEAGQTEFANMQAAYEALPSETKQRIENLTAVHVLENSRRLAGTSEFIEEEKDRFPPMPQPVILAHPRTGQKALYIGSHASHIVGWPVDDGRRLLEELLDFATQPQFVFSKKWQLGDLVMWDNRSVLHRGIQFDETRFRRDLRRTSVVEVIPSAGHSAEHRSDVDTNT